MCVLFSHMSLKQNGNTLVITKWQMEYVPKKSKFNFFCFKSILSSSIYKNIVCLTVAFRLETLQKNTASTKSL